MAVRRMAATTCQTRCFVPQRRSMREVGIGMLQLKGTTVASIRAKGPTKSHPSNARSLLFEAQGVELGATAELTVVKHGERPCTNDCGVHASHSTGSSSGEAVLPTYGVGADAGHCAVILDAGEQGAPGARDVHRAESPAGKDEAVGVASG